MIRISYVMKKECINHSNISKFAINQRDRRNIREGKVKEIAESLKEGRHFSAPFVVNEIENVWRLMDGNHRYEAMKRVLAENKNFSIDVWMAVYRNLTPQQEREVYTLWNKGTAQSSTDFLKAHFETIPLGKEMLKRLPVTIYGDNLHLPIKTLVGGQIAFKKRKKFEGGYSAGKEETIWDFQQLTPEDIDAVEEFYDLMTKCFGKYHKENRQFYQTTPLCAFYRIWADNKLLSKEKMVKAFVKVFTSRPEFWQPTTSAGGRSACRNFYTIAIPSLNGAYNSIRFMNDDEALEEYEKTKAILQVVKRIK